MRSSLLVLAVTALLSAACAGGAATSSPVPPPTPSPDDGQTRPPEGIPMDFETVEAGQHSGAGGDAPILIRIDTQPQWDEFWARHKSIVTPAAELPPVDFPREMVIAALDRVEPTGGYRLEITAIVPDIDSVIVLVEKAAPGEGCILTQALTQPYHIVRTAQVRVMLDLVISEETYDCG